MCVSFQGESLSLRLGCQEQNPEKGIFDPEYFVHQILMNKRDVFKIRQVRGEASSVPLMPGKQCVEGLEFSPCAEKEAGLVTWLKAPYCLPIPAFLITCDPGL